MLDTVRHPVIVRGFDAVLDGDRPHLLLEHLEGPRLSSLVRRHGPLALEQLLPLALELASALHYLAGRELVHLDVKPGNVVMGAPARLIDLSVARSVDEAAALRHVVGTDGYLSPEQAAAGRRSGRPGVRRLRVGRDAVPREHRPGTGAGRRGPRGRPVGLRGARAGLPRPGAGRPADSCRGRGGRRAAHRDAAETCSRRLPAAAVPLSSSAAYVLVGRDASRTRRVAIHTRQAPRTWAATRATGRSVTYCT